MIFKLGFGLGTLFLFVSAGVRLNMVLQYQYTHHHKLWLRDGKPHGIGWYPEETSAGNIFGIPIWVYFGSQIAHAIAVIRYLFSTPEWVKDEPYLILTLRHFRLYFLGAAAALMIGLILPQNFLE